MAKAATTGIQSYFADLLHERRARPRTDLVTHLVTAEIDGVPFAEEDFGPASEVLGLMMVLFLGGVESTAGLTGTLFKLLAENPDQRTLLRENPALIPDAVEEAIRLATPLQLVGRTAARDVTLHGVTIPAGGRVVLVYGAANRDERRFADPDRFDVTRGRFRHLGFGEGMHGCLGAPLARLEAAPASSTTSCGLAIRSVSAGRGTTSSGPRPDTLVYCCGPEPLLAAVEDRCRAWPPRSLRVERFSARPLTAPVRAEAFEVELAASELTLTVPPDRSILDVVEEAGVGVLSSCAEGTCGTCETGVLSGVADHRDSVLTAEERRAADCMMICVFRSCTERLVLDL